MSPIPHRLPIALAGAWFLASAVGAFDLTLTRRFSRRRASDEDAATELLPQVTDPSREWRIRELEP